MRWLITGRCGGSLSGDVVIHWLECGGSIATIYEDSLAGDVVVHGLDTIPVCGAWLIGWKYGGSLAGDVVVHWLQCCGAGPILTGSSTGYRLRIIAFL